MEDLIEIIFYVIVLVLSGIGSLLKNRKKEQPRPNVLRPQEEVMQPTDAPQGDPAQSVESPEEEENELIRMLREAAEAAEAKQREQAMLEAKAQEEAAHQEALRRQAEIAQQERVAAQIRAQREAEIASRKQEAQKSESRASLNKEEADFDVDLTNIDVARRAFIASEIFNKKYC